MNTPKDRPDRSGPHRVAFEKNKNIIFAKAEKIYNIFTKNFEELSESQKKMYRRVNNFKVLEYASKEFEKEYITELL